MGSTTEASGRGESPKRLSPPRQEAQSDETLKAEPAANAEVAKPLAPPPRPSQQQQGNTPDFFGGPGGGGSLSLEPNPFEQSFGGAPPETPVTTKLPSVAALTSPSSLLPGTGNTPYHWASGSLRTGPLSPAMLSGPTNTSDYFSDTHHMRGGFPTPNESSLRTGLTPGGSGSMFPVPSPNSALFAQLGGTGATPGSLDFHRTALSAAAAKREASQTQAPSIITTAPEATNGTPLAKSELKAPAGPLDPHDNDAANGLFLLAQGRNGTAQTQNHQYAAAQQVQGQPAPARSVPSARMSPQRNGVSLANSVRGVSVGSAGSDESESARRNTRGKGKRNPGTAIGRRKAEEILKARASKKAKTDGPSPDPEDMDMMSEDDIKMDSNGHKTKMSEEDKRKNFLERNRIAALKCRQRKKQWLANLQSKVELYSSENDALTAQITQLREEVVNLKTLLLAHKDCPVTQQQGLHGAFMQQTMEAFNPQMNPYGMAASLPNQPVMAGQAVNRRYS